jgi:hypothetical protein
MRIGPTKVRRRPSQKSAKDLETAIPLWEIPNVKTLTVDDQKRIRIPDAKPRQVFAYENRGDGTLTLTLLEAPAKERFPRGSLKKYITADSNKEMLQVLKGCSLEVPE